MQNEIANTVAKMESETSPYTLTRQIGPTTFTINVHFDERSTETLEDKILRLIEREVTNNA